MQTIPRSFLCKTAFLVLLFFCCVWNLVAQTNVITFTNLQGIVYKNIRVVKINANGLIYLYNDGVGGGSIKLSEMPEEVLQKFGYNSAQAISHDREQSAQDANRRLENAIAAGSFREVDGIAYDLRKSQPDWVVFQNVKLFQRLTDGDALVDPNPEAYSMKVFHVKHLPGVSDTELFSIQVKPIGTYDYINKADNTRSVRSYDVGRICRRDEIPEPLLKGQVAFARISASTTSLNELLPSSEANSLTATGTGFLITEDGYIVTNNHVVKGATKLRVRKGSKTLDAQLVKTSKAFDLAVLKVEGTFNSLPLDFDHRMGLGDAVFTIGFPNIDVQGAAPKYTDGKISSLSGMEDDPSQYQVTVPIQPGNSGGPLIAENGAVVGIVRAKLNDLTALANSGSVPQNVNYAVKAKYLGDLLETIPGAMSKIKSPKGPQKSNDAVKTAEDAAVIVLVY
ncbi:MAG: hypothetical protein JWR19_2624 [Pedosphaera sp.]|nr:hypothetical protein [Pedosphaera sp.]